MARFVMEISEIGTWLGYDPAFLPGPSPPADH
jgi:hypothetical protein